MMAGGFGWRSQKPCVGVGVGHPPAHVIRRQHLRSALTTELAGHVGAGVKPHARSRVILDVDDPEKRAVVTMIGFRGTERRLGDQWRR